MKIEILPDVLKNINQGEIISNLGNVWKKIYKILFFVLLFGAIALGSFIWNRNLYSLTWSSQQKQAYMDSQDKGVVFNENNFKKALDIVNQRKEENAKTPDIEKDFFSSY